jgi:diguanylate cyclase (GGDEF)-like protein
MRPTAICRLCAAIVLTLAALPLSAKTIRQYIWARWQDPLPHATVLSLAQTRDGYLWAGTADGLARFNGSTFTIFDKRGTPLQNTTITSLLAASDGSLWIGTGCGLYRLTGLMIRQVARSSACGTVRAMAEDREGTVWVAGESLDTALARMWAEHSRTGGSLAAILCDIDHFKKYNDTYGHQGGDETLIRVARSLASAVPRSTDIVARFGGEEFVILLGNCSLDEAMLVAERVLESVRALAIDHRSSTTEPFVTVSLGVAAIVPDHTAAPESLVREADDALYRAKEQGRNRYAAFV